MADKTQYIELIYSRGHDLQVWKGRNDGNEVVIKVLYFNTIIEANTVFQEVFNMMRFKDTPGVATVYDCQINQADQRFFIRIIMKLYKNKDLSNLIQSHRHYFEETQLMSHLTRLVNIFAFFQEKSIAHRDIKPENIFVDDDMQLVVGDLGCALEISSQRTLDSLAGTPLYLSPKLRTAYISLVKGEQPDLNHNVFKSDVYSLGMTFLYMMTRQPLTEIVSDPTPEAIRYKTETKLTEFSTSYPTFTYFLREMLQFEEKDRADFIILKKKLMLGSILTCSNCMKNAQISMILDKFLVCQQCFTQLQGWILTKMSYYYPQSQIQSLTQIFKEFEFCLLCDSSHQITALCTFSSMQNQQCCELLVIHNSIWKKCQKNLEHSLCVVCQRGIGFNHTLCVKLTQNPRSDFIIINQ